MKLGASASDSSPAGAQAFPKSNTKLTTSELPTGHLFSFQNEGLGMLPTVDCGHTGKWESSASAQK